MIGAPVFIDRIGKVYGSQTAVGAVTLDVPAGEFLSILGPSGSGKTTLLTMIAGFESPSAGRIIIDGRDVTAVSPDRRNIGMVFQRYALFPHLTVAENIAFPLKMRGIRKDLRAERVGQALHLVQLPDYAKRYPHELSGGQQQRVAVARAIVFEPPVLLMDEPLGALDKKLRESMQIEIKQLQRRLGATVIYVTHDQEEALTMSDRIAVMAKGQLAQLGTPADLYCNPQSAFVADFIGKMNFLTGEFLGETADSQTIRLGDDVVIDTPAHGFEGSAKIGDRVRLALRPERLGLAARGAGGQNALPGRIETSVFAGSFDLHLVRSDFGSGEIIQVQIPADGKRVPFAMGALVDVVAERDGLRLFAVAEA
ncbi:polyamine ABC transporter ATP-binding protein [Rhizobium leguminosarum bv. viciae]|uniref:Spermidine/putrescine import ATP-binding protein PotA n=1 Tax=Rhizobium leguminosarum bv. viciae TaxID=387 RepID=A0A8I2KNB4_RHILV|nr:ABC transporter ATP-binding protein [Rhizobium leguminosarum]ASR11772.1 polyamine ABC transporter ATP-binding protein [Rhizobium leguminosarum bv. viciae]MBY5750290.1 ABC transporter ATP-binding protein [Rhizobium leguminosarum]MBY5770156.1 ABC transporter ATP-binding protein [Rhizobium leguminosarum]MBY5793616.1 ABC transporter ATP-binding protein [Rhizobium leguminosarum]NKM50280.1 polyamine ABC transporter ATP-binding protein [Rhizobium leguminosarum bv. viciae]